LGKRQSVAEADQWERVALAMGSALKAT
jgi:hypothetical protein